MYVVRKIKPIECDPWLLKKHYAKRMPPISYAFGLYSGGILSGVCTFGTPVSSPLRVGVCGEDYRDDVLELNRLCLKENRPNEASFLVSKSLKLLPSNKIIISYADTEQGHVGYVYQATNFIYTGLSAKRTDWKVKGLEHLHGATIADMSRGRENRAEWMRKKFGDDFYLKDRPRKHRYIFFTGSGRQKKLLRNNLKYPVLPYPKGETKRYDAGGEVTTQKLLF